MTMIKISPGFADMLEEQRNTDLTGFEQTADCLDLYRLTFSEYRSYHVLDSQFDTLYDKKKPGLPPV